MAEAGGGLQAIREGAGTILAIFIVIAISLFIVNAMLQAAVNGAQNSPWYNIINNTANILMSQFTTLATIAGIVALIAAIMMIPGVRELITSIFRGLGGA